MANPTLEELGILAPQGPGLLGNLAPTTLKVADLKDSLEDQGTAFLIYGASGIGKTTLAFSLSPRPGCTRYVVNTEGGLSVVRDREAKVYTITSYGQMQQVRMTLPSVVKKGDVVIADSVTEWLRINALAALEYPVKRFYSEVPVLQDWGLIIERMRDGMRDLRNLRAKGVDVILICGERYDKDENLGTFVGGPSLAGQLAAESMYLVDEVYHMVSMPGPAGERRLFYTVPHLFWNAKTRNDLPSMVECPKGEMTLDKYFRKGA